MRLERTIAVMVLATGVICAGVALAANPKSEDKPAAPAASGAPAAPAPPAAAAGKAYDPADYPPGLKTKVDYNPWIPTEIKPEHAVLAGLAGKFTTKVHVFSGPYARINDTEGTAEGKLLMGGAFVQLTHSELRMKQPFEALAIYGYDQATRKYTSVSIDNNSTAIVTHIGSYDPAKKQFVMTGRYQDQGLRTMRLVRTVTTFIDADNWTYEEFVTDRVGGKETPRVTIAYKRS